MYVSSTTYGTGYYQFKTYEYSDYLAADTNSNNYDPIYSSTGTSNYTIWMVYTNGVDDHLIFQNLGSKNYIKIVPLTGQQASTLTGTSYYNWYDITYEFQIEKTTNNNVLTTYNTVEVALTASTPNVTLISPASDVNGYFTFTSTSADDVMLFVS